jgi:hypothetical protein
VTVTSLPRTRTSFKISCRNSGFAPICFAAIRRHNSAIFEWICEFGIGKSFLPGGAIMIERLFLFERFSALFMELLYSSNRLSDQKSAGFKGISPTLQTTLKVNERESNRVLLGRGLILRIYRVSYHSLYIGSAGGREICRRC